MVLYDHMFVVFLRSQSAKNDKREKRKYRPAAGSARQVRKSYVVRFLLVERKNEQQKEEKNR